MIVTNRDRKVIDFINEMNCVSTRTIYELFYPSLRVTQNRLKLMADNKVVKRDRDNITNQYYYYMDIKPKQIHHNILLSNFYNELRKIAKIEAFKKEFTIADIRPDGLAVYTINKQSYIACIEVELSNKPDVEKYEKLYSSGKYKSYFGGVFPLIIFITDKMMPDTKLKVVSVNESIENLRGIIS